MKKILVPIDFSANSKKAIRFAIQFASQTNSEIIFFYVVSIMPPTTEGAWDFPYYPQFQEDEVKRSQNYMEKLIKKVAGRQAFSGISYKCISQLSTNINTEINTFAEEHKVDFICIGATGTGVLGKLFGTVASYLMVHSKLPVIVVPKNYRLKPLADICLSTDMEDPEAEIKKVLKLADSLSAMVSVVHFDYEIDLTENMAKFTQITRKFESDTVRFRYRKLNALHPLNDHLRKFIVQNKPSLLVLFTKQNRNWFDRLIVRSNSVDMSFSAKVPLLVYRKMAK